MVRELEKLNLSPVQEAVKKIQSPTPAFMQISDTPNASQTLLMDKFQKKR
jgi:hypothetical protein